MAKPVGQTGGVGVAQELTSISERILRSDYFQPFTDGPEMAAQADAARGLARLGFAFRPAHRSELLAALEQLFDGCWMLGTRKDIIGDLARLGTTSA